MRLSVEEKQFYEKHYIALGSVATENQVIQNKWRLKAECFKKIKTNITSEKASGNREFLSILLLTSAFYAVISGLSTQRREKVQLYKAEGFNNHKIHLYSCTRQSVEKSDIQLNKAEHQRNVCSL